MLLFWHAKEDWIRLRIKHLPEFGFRGPGSFTQKVDQLPAPVDFTQGGGDGLRFRTGVGQFDDSLKELLIQI
jgi:hypothetical protein